MARQVRSRPGGPRVLSEAVQESPFAVAKKPIRKGLRASATLSVVSHVRERIYGSTIATRLELIPSAASNSLPPPVRRSGERREPLQDIRLPPDFLRACLGRSVHPAVVAELAVEAAVATEEFARIGVGELWPAVVEAAARARLTGIPSPQRAYLRALTLGSGYHPKLAMDPDDVVVEIPIRLFPRALAVLESAFSSSFVADGLALEIAAVSSGRTMMEWTLVTALTLRSGLS
jgi:hypothetical protein